MYKFTNGVVVYDEVTRDKYVRAGMTLIEEKPEKKEEEKVGDKNLRSDVKSKEFGKTRKRTEKFGRNFK
jgi:hypothetical protein